MKELTKDDYEYINDIRKSIKTRGKDRGDITTQEQARAYISSVIRMLFGVGALMGVGTKRIYNQKNKKTIKDSRIKLYDYDKDFFALHSRLAEFRDE